MQALDKMKEQKIEGELDDATEEDSVSPKEAKRQQKIEIAQNMRDDGMVLDEIKKKVEMSKGWVVNNTKKPVTDGGE
jgi:hypothetical protein